MGVAILLLVCVFAVGVALATLHVWRRTRGIPSPARIVVRDGEFVRMAEGMMPNPEQLPGALVDDGKTSWAWAESMHRAPEGSGISRGGSAGLSAAAALDGMGPAADMWMRWEAVDDSVFQAVSHMTHTAVDSFGDLMKAVDIKGYALQTDGFINKLVGHIGEWRVQEHFMSAGAGVSMPFASNEPGLDMWLDGHAVNVKNVADVTTAAREHFMLHPDIPIVVPADAAHIPEDALHFDPADGVDLDALGHSDHLVIVDHALSHAETVEHAHGAVDTLVDSGPHLNIPWVTLAVSSFREGRLLMEGSTEVGRAAKNIAVDTAAVGGGGFLGAKAGAAIGTAIAPGVGTLIGTAIGGIVGAFAGRSAANAIKRAPMEEAKAALVGAQGEYRGAEKMATQYAADTWERRRDEEQRRLGSAISDLKSRQAAALSSLRAVVVNSTRLSSADAEQYLKAAQNVLEYTRDQAHHRAPESFPALLRFLAQRLAPTASREAKALADDVMQWQTRASRLMSQWSNGQESTNQLFDLVVAVPGGRRHAEDFLVEAVRTRKAVYTQVTDIMKKTCGAIVGLRQSAVERLRGHWKNIEAEVSNMLLAPKARLESAMKQLQWELGAAGKK